VVGHENGKRPGSFGLKRSPGSSRKTPHNAVYADSLAVRSSAGTLRTGVGGVRRSQEFQSDDYRSGSHAMALSGGDANLDSEGIHVVAVRHNASAIRLITLAVQRAQLPHT
jgi:hypothetical protein